MERDDDIGRTRLYDLADHERIHVQCQCGFIVEFHPAMFPKQYRTPSDTLVYNLQFKLKCSHCGRKAGFEIAIMSRRMVDSSSNFVPSRTMVPVSDEFLRAGNREGGRV